MSRLAVAGICAVVLLVGFAVGRTTGKHTRTVTLSKTVERAVVVSAQHLGSARDARNAGPLDLADVTSKREGDILRTTITTRNAWTDALIRSHRAHLSVLYDVNRDGKADHVDVFYVFHRELTAWISDFNQGVQYAKVTRRSATKVTIDRDASLFYSQSGEGIHLTTSPIDVAVVARWHGGTDRVPDHGWITVPPPP
jgi:hypothetical protein